MNVREEAFFDVYAVGFAVLDTVMVLNVSVIGIHWVVDYVGTNMDVVATTEDVANLHIMCVKSTIKPAPAASTGGVSGDANVTVTATLLSIQIAIDPPPSSVVICSAKKDICLSYFFSLYTYRNIISVTPLSLTTNYIVSNFFPTFTTQSLHHMH